MLTRDAADIASSVSPKNLRIAMLPIKRSTPPMQRCPRRRRSSVALRYIVVCAAVLLFRAYSQYI